MYFITLWSTVARRVFAAAVRTRPRHTAPLPRAPTMAAALLPRVLVFDDPAQPSLTLTVLAAAATTGTEPATFLRARDEPVGATLGRLAKKFGGGACILRGPDGAALPADTPNTLAWRSSHTLDLPGAAPLPIVVNAPRVTAVKLHNRPMVGCPLWPHITFDGAASDATFAWRWARHPAAGGGVVVGEARVYVPTDADVGAELSVTVTPVDAAGVAGLPVTARMSPGRKRPAPGAAGKKYKMPGNEARGEAAAAATPPPPPLNEALVAPFPGFDVSVAARLAACATRNVDTDPAIRCRRGCP